MSEERQAEVLIARLHSPGSVPRSRGRLREPSRRLNADAVALTRAPEIELVKRSLEERDQLLAIAARVVHLGGWTVDLADGLVHLSDEVCAIHELPLGSTLTGEQAVEFYAPESRSVIDAAFAACSTDGIPYDLELEIITATGRRIAVREIGEAVRGTDGRIERVHGAFQDLSALREAEANAERIGARLVRTLEHVTDAFYTLDREWRYTYVNAEAERIQEKTRAEMLGNVVWDVFPEAVGTVFDTEFHRAVETGETVAFVSYYPPLDLWAEVRAHPIEDGLAVYFLDVSAKRAAEQDLAASEKRYRTLFERAGDAILIMDDEAVYLDANDSAATMLGVPREAIIGRSLNDFVEEALPNLAWTAFKAAGELSGELRFRRPNGEIREAEFNAVASISPGIHLSVLRDVTDRRRLDKQRGRILDALRHVCPLANELEETANAICVEIVDNGDFTSAAIFGVRDGARRDAARRAIQGRSRRECPRRTVRSPPGSAEGQGGRGSLGRRLDRGRGCVGRAAMAAVGVSAAVFRPDRVGRPSHRRARGRRRERQPRSCCSGCLRWSSSQRSPDRCLGRVSAVAPWTAAERAQNPRGHLDPRLPFRLPADRGHEEPRRRRLRGADALFGRDATGPGVPRRRRGRDRPRAGSRHDQGSAEGVGATACRDASSTSTFRRTS